VTILDELARQSAVIVPHAGWGTLSVTGPERKSWLQGLVTCDLESLTAGQGTWGLALNRLGKIQSVIWVVATSEALWLALAPGTLDAIETELGRMLIMEDAELERPASPHTWFALHGPDAAARARALAAAHAGAAAPIDWTGLGGAALAVASERAARVLADCQGRVLEPADWTRLRLERGLPEFGTDFDSRDRPHEAALERRAVNWSKGCYLGQEVVCMQDMRGKVKHSLAVLRVEAPKDAELVAPAQVFAGDSEVGAIKSVAFSEATGAWLAMTRLDKSAAAAKLEYRAASHAWPAALFSPPGSQAPAP
jgi:folate-binding protein YgfZ